jgi:hypothetical protein
MNAVITLVLLSIPFVLIAVLIALLIMVIGKGSGKS